MFLLLFLHQFQFFELPFHRLTKQLSYTHFNLRNSFLSINEHQWTLIVDINPYLKLCLYILMAPPHRQIKLGHVTSTKALTRLMQVVSQKICWDPGDCFLKTSSYLDVELCLNNVTDFDICNRWTSYLLWCILRFQCEKRKTKKNIVKLLKSMDYNHLMHIASLTFKEISIAITVVDLENSRGR